MNRGTELHFNGRLRAKTNEPTNWVDLIKLPNEKLAFIYQRLSSHEQMKKSIYSIKAQDALYDLASEDGYLDTQIHMERRDLGISGTKGREEREGLAYLIKLVETDLVEAVYVVHISRLYRDQTLINAFALGELFKEHNVIIVTPQMRLNLRDKMHMRLYRMETERAADELELMVYRLGGARNLKARAGYYAGEAHAPGYVIDERKVLDTGEANPDYHTYRIYEPHAEVVETIFKLLLSPDMTPTRIVRYCKGNDIYFPAFPPELDTPSNRKTFVRSLSNGVGFPVTRHRVYSIAQNPAYIGWKIWAGEVVSKDALPPIIDEEIFWAVQKRFDEPHPGPKKDNDPLPLAGLLHCANHHKMGFANAHGRTPAIYQCYDRGFDSYCGTISAHILDDPIHEAVLGEVGAPDVADEVLNQLTNEYEQAREKAATYRREMKRLESEVEHLRQNMSAGVLSAKQLAWLDGQIETRLAKIRELADLEKQPIGEAVGKPAPGLADIDMVRSFLENLDKTWDDTPNGLKNAFLSILLNKVIIWPEPDIIRVRLCWRVGLEQELKIYRPRAADSRPDWTGAEVETLRQHYPETDTDELLAMLPGRTWRSVRCKAQKLGLRRDGGRKASNTLNGEAYTPEEDDIICRYYAGKMTLSECIAQTGRTVDGINKRGKRLGLTWQHPRPTWEWVRRTVENDQLSERPGPK